jgi:hypothetical protein
MLPYLDRDLLELTLRLHPDRLIAGGRMKTPLRRLLAERLPGVRLPVRKVDFGRMFDDLFRPELGRAWPAMGGARALGDLGVVDPAAVDRLMAGYLAGDGAGRFRAWLLLSTEAWVRAHRAAPVRREEVPA